MTGVKIGRFCKTMIHCQVNMMNPVSERGELHLLDFVNRSIQDDGVGCAKAGDGLLEAVDLLAEAFSENRRVFLRSMAM